jgi:hypothetical protein
MMKDSSGLTHSKIIKLLTPYLTVYPACKLEASGLMLYARALQDVPLDELDAAMVRLMRTSKFFPTVAEILESVKTTREVISGKDTSGAGAAWHEAMELVRHVGPYRPWTYSSPAVERAVKQFGKIELCELETDDVNTARAQFMRIYNAEAERERGREEVRATLKALGGNRAMELVKRLAASKAMEPKQLRAAE